MSLVPSPDTRCPSFARGFRFRHDAVRDQWVVLGPERAFLPDPTATEVLKLVDGTARLNDIIDQLAERFAAPRPTIAQDVTAMVEDLAAKGVLRF